MSDVITLADYRPALPRLVHSAPAMPRAPRPGLCKGDFVRIKSDGRVGWIREQIEGQRGLMLRVSVPGVVMVVAASEVEPVSAA